ncbi:Cthe_2314 family HEPN domain-containing protein [Clostridium cylindrosporum]|uniref:Cthe-2314-like HEPN domain-containing protein n=1 Tax=Clostridium cylindrosporum DSM 605 TaxID=1121307 RepID=A0A0J8DAG9_CLOCY|nr:Cthe_2314 family HEPN domain-containing protein [Clostridium cylindrosporum]KMT22847.1 hypothetical protein CLCY_5c00860 [Clostridium cylindrosporum DSM 605]
MFKYWFIDKKDQIQIAKDHSFIDNLKFDFKYKTTRKEIDYLDLGYTLDPWLIQLRIRLRELRFSIINFIYFYNKNIDDRTICDLGEDNGRFFPNLSDEGRGYLFQLNYFYGNFQVQYISIIDALYHVLNIYYDINVDGSFGFNKNIIKKVKMKNQGISNRLENFWKDCKISRYRNDKIHNYDPNIPDKGYDESRKGVIMHYCPRYIHSKEKYELLNEECIKMEQLLKDIKRYMGKDTNKHLDRVDVKVDYNKPKSVDKVKGQYKRKKRKTK